MIRAERVGGRILVEAGLAYLSACRRIPGARYEEARRAWSYPDTAVTVQLLTRLIPELRRSEALQGVTSGPATASRPQPAPAPPKPVSKPGIAAAAKADSVQFTLPDAIRTDPWRHQVAAVEFALKAFDLHMGGALLAMAMGTGKTLVALILLVLLKSKKVLILCPRRVIPVWQDQIAWHLRIPVIAAALDDSRGSVIKRTEYAQGKLKLAEAVEQPFVVIINFDACHYPAFASWSHKMMWDLVIVDESHRTKLPGGKASLYLKSLRSRATHRLMLTGTPMPHSLLDIFAQARFLDPRVYGNSYVAFRSEYAMMGGFKNKQVIGFRNQEQLIDKMKSFVFRVEADVLDLPPAVHMDYECELTDKAQRAYDQIETNLITDIDSGTVTAANGMVRLLRLQQITGGALKADESERYDRIDTSKSDLLTDLLEDLGPDEPWVCFCRFHADLDAVHRAAAQAAATFEREDYTSLELSGRQDDLARWRKGEGLGLAVQAAAGGVGVDLTRARYSIFYSLSFSLGEYDQALARTVRPGQTRSVTHIHLVARHTIDGRILRALHRRAEVIGAVLAELKGTRVVK